MRRPLYVITGAMAAGKSTVADALARRFDRAVHLRGDVFRRMIVAGAAEMEPLLSEEGERQLRLRHDVACAAARLYLEADFTVVYQDILVGADLARVAAILSDLEPRIVVLDPSVETLAARDAARAKTGYGGHFPPDVLKSALERETPRIGLWLDTSEMTVEETVARILSRD